MKLENLIKGGRRGLAAGLLGLGILGIGSMPAYGQEKPTTRVSYIPCMSQTQDEGGTGEALSVLGLIIGMNPKNANNAQAQTLSTVLSVTGAMEQQKEVAREGRSQININQGGQTVAERYLPAPGCVWVNPENPNYLMVRKSIGLVFVANGWEDLNYNRRPDLNEYIGVKDRFYDDEEIILVVYDQAGQGIGGRWDNNLKVEVYNPEGRRIIKKDSNPNRLAFGGMLGAINPGRSGYFESFKKTIERKNCVDGCFVFTKHE